MCLSDPLQKPFYHFGVCINVDYWQVLAQFTEMTSRYAREMQAVSYSAMKLYSQTITEWALNEFKFLWMIHLLLQIDELLKQRNEIHASYTTGPPIKRSSSRNRSRSSSKEIKEDGEVREKKPSLRDRAKKKRWYNLHLKVDKRKPCWLW